MINLMEMVVMEYIVYFNLETLKFRTGGDINELEKER